MSSHAIPSRFLSELPEELVEDVGPSASAGRLGPGRDVPSWGRRRGAARPRADDDAFFDAGASHDADDWHDPDPWGDSGDEPRARAADEDRPRPTRSSAPRRSASGRGPGRLPKMAEWKFGQRS
jgi:hypothetical protein